MRFINYRDDDDDDDDWHVCVCDCVMLLLLMMKIRQGRLLGVMKSDWKVELCKIMRRNILPIWE